MCVLGVTFALIFAQAIFITSPAGYIRAFHFSPKVIFVHTVYYAKTLSYVWQNGFSKKIQIIFAMVFTILAGFGFGQTLWKHKSAQEFYLLGYLAILIPWNAEIGLRGLMPVMPLYFIYGFEQFERIMEPRRLPAKRAALASLLFLCGLTYSGEHVRETMQEPEPNVNDPTARELFSFLKINTRRSEIIIFPKPRSLTLFTCRRAASFVPGESPENSVNFMKEINATILVKPEWSPPSWQNFLESYKSQMDEISHNSGYQVFRVNWERSPSATATSPEEFVDSQ